MAHLFLFHHQPMCLIDFNIDQLIDIKSKLNTINHFVFIFQQNKKIDFRIFFRILILFFFCLVRVCMFQALSKEKKTEFVFCFFPNTFSFHFKNK